MDKQLKDKLLVPLPPESITPHATKTYLSSIKAIYVTERFNEVFGIGGWTTKVEHTCTQPKKADSKFGDMVVVKVTFEVPAEGIYYEAYGGNDNLDLGDAYKGAMTDALTKIGSYLGVGIDVFKGKVKSQEPYKKEPNQVTVATDDIPF
jgi:hypothetical protein